MNKFCCGFGHSDNYNINTEKLSELLYTIIHEHNVANFFISDFGFFDQTFHSCVNNFKKTNSNIKLILVKPYNTKELSNNSEYYKYTYDEIIIPEFSANAYYKSAITIRNRWMIENSDFIISNVYRNFGGAYTAIKYAEKLEKNILYLPN